MKKLSGLSIFFPAFNDAQSLPDLIKRAHDAAYEVTKRFEVIVINDGSTDTTAQVLKALMENYPTTLRAVTHTTNRGYGQALRSGFRTSRYKWVFYTDGDGQYDPLELTQLVHQLTAATDVVNGYKIKRSDAWIRTVIGSIYNWWLHQQYPLPIRDIDCDFRLIRRSMLQKIHLTSTSGTICLELITKLSLAGARFAEVPIHHYPRRFGRSQFFRPRHLLSTLKEMVR